MTRPIIGRVVPERWRTTGATAPGQRTVGEPGTARIAVDLLGGDQAPAVVVDGALRACKADPALHLTLVGPADAADSVLAALKPGDRRDPRPYRRIVPHRPAGRVGHADHRPDRFDGAAVLAVGRARGKDLVGHFPWPHEVEAEFGVGV